MVQGPGSAAIAIAGKDHGCKHSLAWMAWLGMYNDSFSKRIPWLGRLDWMWLSPSRVVVHAKCWSFKGEVVTILHGAEFE